MMITLFTNDDGDVNSTIIMTPKGWEEGTNISVVVVVVVVRSGGGSNLADIIVVEV